VCPRNRHHGAMGPLGYNKKGLCPPVPVFYLSFAPPVTRPVPLFICLLLPSPVPCPLFYLSFVPVPVPLAPTAAAGVRGHNRGRKLARARGVHQHRASHNHVHLGHLHLHVRAPEPAVGHVCHPLARHVPRLHHEQCPVHAHLGHQELGLLATLLEEDLGHDEVHRALPNTARGTHGADEEILRPRLGHADHLNHAEDHEALGVLHHLSVRLQRGSLGRCHRAHAGLRLPALRLLVLARHFYQRFCGLRVLEGARGRLPIGKKADFNFFLGGLPPLLHPFWTPSLPLLDPFLTPSGPLLDPFWTPSLPLLDPFWSPSGPLLDPFWTPSGPLLDPFWTPSEPFYPLLGPFTPF